MLFPLPGENKLDLEKLSQSGQCFRWEHAVDGAFVIPAFGRRLSVVPVDGGMLKADCSPDDWQSVWARYFDLTCDYESARCLILPEYSYMLAAADSGRGVTILKQEYFETVVSFVISQNNNIPRIRGILRALCEDTYPAFPTAAQIKERGLSYLETLKMGYRAKYVLAAADFVQNDNANLSVMTTEELITHLTGCLGVGNKVASCVALYGCGRKDAFPRDVWVKRILLNRYPAGFPYFGPYAGVYQQWMFDYERNSFPRPNEAGGTFSM